MVPSLPIEVILKILRFVKDDDPLKKQACLYHCALISRNWHSASLPLLYREPQLAGSRFPQFISTVCRSPMPMPGTISRLHIDYLLSLVKVLNMQTVRHECRIDMVIELLQNVHANLEEFYAPPFFFGDYCFGALSKCLALRVLDLEFVELERDKFQMFFDTICKLPLLSKLSLLVEGNGDRWSFDYSLPSTVESFGLTFQGKMTHFEITQTPSCFPKGLTHFQLMYCPGEVAESLMKLGFSNLTSLTLLSPMHIQAYEHPSSFIDTIPYYAPNLKSLHIDICYITSGFFRARKMLAELGLPTNAPDYSQQAHPLKYMWLHFNPYNKTYFIEDVFTPSLTVMVRRIRSEMICQNVIFFGVDQNLINLMVDLTELNDYYEPTSHTIEYRNQLKKLDSELVNRRMNPMLRDDPTEEEEISGVWITKDGNEKASKQGRYYEGWTLEPVGTASDGWEARLEHPPDLLF